jgi:hypothetical protein
VTAPSFLYALPLSLPQDANQLSSLIRGERTCRSGRDLPDCRPTFRSKLCFASDANEAVRTRLNRDTRSHLCGGDSSAVAAVDGARRSGRFPPQHPDQHRPERPVLLAVDQ